MKEAVVKSMSSQSYTFLAKILVDCRSLKMRQTIWQTICQASFLVKPCCCHVEYSWLINKIKSIMNRLDAVMQSMASCRAYRWSLNTFLIDKSNWYETSFMFLINWWWIPVYQLFHFSPLLMAGRHSESSRLEDPPLPNTNENKFLKEITSCALM